MTQNGFGTPPIFSNLHKKIVTVLRSETYQAIMIHLSIIIRFLQAVKGNPEKRGKEKTTLGTHGAVCDFRFLLAGRFLQQHLEVDGSELLVDAFADIVKHLLECTAAGRAAVALPRAALAHTAGKPHTHPHTGREITL